jgi:parallel beta-helix repeat protein
MAADIRSFGARCDGSDDSGAINAAFNSLPNGSTLQLNCTLGIGPSGVLLGSKQGVIVDGAGGSIIGLANNPAKILIRVEACNNCTIRNLTINANNVGAAGLGLHWSSGSTLANNTISNITLPAAAGIVAMGNSNNTYTGNTVAGTSGYGGDASRGIWIGNASTQTMDRNATITNNNVRDIAATALVVQSAGATVSGNVVERAQGSGVKIEPVQGQGGQTVVEGNTLRNNAWHGVQCERCDAPVVIRNNTFASNTVSGVYASGGVFNGAQISNNSFSGNGQAGIYMYDGRGVSIQSNQFSGNGNGIVIEAGPSSSLGNVTVASNEMSGSNGDGMVVRGRGGYFNGLNVSSNNFTSNRRYGMSMEETNAGAITGVGMSGNCFSGNGVGGLLDLRASDRLSISVSSGCGALTVGVTAGSTTSSMTVPTTTTTTTTTTSSSTANTSGMTPIRVNAGGSQYTDSQGNVWSGDYGFSGGYVDNFPGSIANTNDAPLYYTGRWNGGNFAYTFQVPSGTRTVTLKFAETYFQSPGRRVFDVIVNGQTVLSSFDIVAASGGIRAAVDRTFQVQSNGQVQIYFAGRVDDPIVNAIEIK